VADDVPEDLVALKIETWTASAAVYDLADRPAAPDQDGREQQRSELEAARAARDRLVADLKAHSWWAQQAHSFEADQAVTRAALASRFGAA
jgi:hypothetical protein